MSARGHVLEVLAGASAALGLERDYINDLNVYPVPDGDTGTNLFLTVQAIIDEADASAVDDLPGPHGRRDARLAHGRPRQFGRDPLADRARRLRVDRRRPGLRRRRRDATRCGRPPTPRTGPCASRSRAPCSRSSGPWPRPPPTRPTTISLPALLTAVTTAGAEAVERTIDQLEALRRAGVVDAGGYGLLVSCGARWPGS